MTLSLRAIAEREMPAYDTIEKGARPYSTDWAQRFIMQMRAGEELAYHRGFLAEDRERKTDHTPESPVYRSEVNSIANLVADLAKRGLGSLVQRRCGPRDSLYLFQRGQG